ncbi:hypothetical protein TSUD_335510 [Trifolium subterraneum]|uniref:Uncharacterized protein n=1 Tax=Trifolium subterraneum TaxID=3900 RepID=A0A2Z6LR99_TRISU|nr:hypothetical protein TSUD_335510 [Trifolium subterraneum]
MPWFRRYFLVKKELIRGLIPTLYQKKTEERYGFIRGMLACPPTNDAFNFQILHMEWRMPLLPVPANKQRL